MIIAFFGHSNFNNDEKFEKHLISLIDSITSDERIDFFLGNYGSFDSFAYKCCKKYKEKNKNASLIFVTPYISEGYNSRLEYAKNMYDMIIYPEIESKPKRLAIYYRNRYMVERADVIICYINKHYGGAHEAIKYAKHLGKYIINIVDEINPSS